jgi:hypothetical protein
MGTNGRPIIEQSPLTGSDIETEEVFEGINTGSRHSFSNAVFFDGSGVRK